MRFTPEPLNHTLGIRKDRHHQNSQEKRNVPSERRIGYPPHVFNCDNKQVPRNWFASGKKQSQDQFFEHPRRRQCASRLHP